MKALAQILLGDFFINDVYLNGKQYFVKKDDANKMLPFERQEHENFPGFDLVSNEIDIVDMNSKEKMHGRIILTYHADLDRWSSILHFEDLNKISTLVSIETIE